MGNDLVSFDDGEDFFSAIEVIKGCNIEKSRQCAVCSSEFCIVNNQELEFQTNKGHPVSYAAAIYFH